MSNQCMALVRDNCLVPTFDAPELGYIKESSNEQYVPDVFYTVSPKIALESGCNVIQLVYSERVLSRFDALRFDQVLYYVEQNL